MKNTFLRKVLLISAGASFLALPLSPTFAATATATLPVSVTVSNNCTVGVTNLAFGTYSGNADVTLPITSTATCTMDIPEYLICADTGVNYAGSRRMADGSGNYLNYEIYQAVGSGTIFGDTGSSDVGTCAGTNAGLAITETGTPLANPHGLVFEGRIPGGQPVPEGSYTDTVTITFFY